MGVEDGFILVHPAAAFTTKQWPVDRFAQLAKLLLADNRDVVATVGPGEDRVLKTMDGLVGQGLKLVAPLPLRRFSGLVSHCGVYVGNDTGTTHIAAAIRKPIVVVFGSSDSRVWYPWQTQARVLRSDLACIPCPGYQCLEYSEPRCIQSIEVSEVYRAVRELLKD